MEAGKRIGSIFKEPTITPSAVQVKKMGLKKAWGSPNGMYTLCDAMYMMYAYSVYVTRVVFTQYKHVYEYMCRCYAQRLEGHHYLP